MNRFVAANASEIARADTKAAVLLAFMGAMLGAFITVTRVSGPEAPRPSWVATPLWWTAVTTALLAISCFVCALAPRRRGDRRSGSGLPGYFQDVTDDLPDDQLVRAFGDLTRHPAGALPASVRRTSWIVRVKYSWIERGIVLLLASLVVFAVGFQPG